MYKPIPLVDLKAQYATIKKEVDEAIQKVLNSAAFIKGLYVNEFEESFAKYCGVKRDGLGENKLHCVGCANGTDAIHLAAWALGIGPEDEVIVPTHTFIGSTEGISQLGAKVVFCDIDPDTFLLDYQSIEALITSKTKAIVAVHLYGQPCNMNQICSLADKHSLFVIEDAAQAHGAFWENDRTGSLGDIACFSFFPGKNLGAYGDAGAVVSKHKELIDKVRQIANHGRLDKYEHMFEGMNSRLDGLHAAILSVKLNHLDKWTEKRNKIADQYSNLLDIEDIGLPKIDPSAYSAWHLYVIKVEQRDELLAYLHEKNIRAGIHYPIPLHLQPAYAKYSNKRNQYPHAEKIASQIISLPIYPELDEIQIMRVVSTIQENMLTKMSV